MTPWHLPHRQKINNYTLIVWRDINRFCPRNLLAVEYNRNLKLKIHKMLSFHSSPQVALGARPAACRLPLLSRSLSNSSVSSHCSGIQQQGVVPFFLTCVQHRQKRVHAPGQTSTVVTQGLPFDQAWAPSVDVAVSRVEACHLLKHTIIGTRIIDFQIARSHYCSFSREFLDNVTCMMSLSDVF